MRVEVYTISTDYINYLISIDEKVLINEKPGEEIRKYVGVMFTINNFEYFVPLSSPKDSDYFIKKNRRIPKGSVTPIYRIFETSNNKRNFLGKLKFSSMIPVPKSELTLLDFSSLKEDYSNMINSQIRHIRKNFNFIKDNHALKLYNEKLNEKLDENFTKNYLKNTVNFKMLESGLAQYINPKDIDNEVALEKDSNIQSTEKQPI